MCEDPAQPYIYRADTTVPDRVASVVEVEAIGEPKGREAIGQQHHDIAPKPHQIRDLEQASGGGSIRHRTIVSRIVVGIGQHNRKRGA